MNTQISTKFAALAVALLVNGLMFSSAAYLFNGQLHGVVGASALAKI